MNIITDPLWVGHSLSTKTDIPLYSLPMPPSQNRAYPTVKTKTGFKRVKSKAMNEYYDAVIVWYYDNLSYMKAIKRRIDTMKPTQRIDVKATFYFQGKNILTKDGRPKRNDTSNRIKALHDALAKLLGIDDCYFWSGTFDKKAIADDSSEYVDVVISIT